jgi:hypothetical protein
MSQKKVMMGLWTNERQWSYEEIQAHIMTMSKQILNRNNHAYYNMYVASLQPLLYRPSNAAQQCCLWAETRGHIRNDCSLGKGELFHVVNAWEDNL